MPKNAGETVPTLSNSRRMIGRVERLYSSILPSLHPVTSSEVHQLPAATLSAFCFPFPQAWIPQTTLWTV